MYHIHHGDQARRRTLPPYTALASEMENCFDFTASTAFIRALCHDDFARRSFFITTGGAVH